MPTTNYMVIDARHDHSLRIPRPDLSVAMGTPNACTNCHTQRDARWAAAKVTAWYGGHPPADAHERLARAFVATDTGAVDGQALLRLVTGDRTQSGIARATAFAELNPPTDAASFEALETALRDSNALVRLGALESAERLPLATRLRLTEPLLSDSLRTVRIEAARLLAAAPVQQLSLERQSAFERAAGEFVESQRYNADRAEARVALGAFLAERGDAAAAEAELQAALRISPSSIPAYVDLADVYRAQGRDADGERILREGLAGAPKSGVLHYALGLALTRLNRADAALGEFARAAGLDPGNARFAYVHAIALHSSGKPDAAIARLKAALTTHPADGDILSALTKFYEERGDSTQARRYADRLHALVAHR
jgi:Tfp pilus assembly protein PilF